MTPGVSMLLLGDEREWGWRRGGSRLALEVLHDIEETVVDLGLF